MLPTTGRIEKTANEKPTPPKKVTVPKLAETAMKIEVASMAESGIRAASEVFAALRTSTLVDRCFHGENKKNKNMALMVFEKTAAADTEAHIKDFHEVKLVLSTLFEFHDSILRTNRQYLGSKEKSQGEKTGRVGSALCQKLDAGQKDFCAFGPFRRLSLEDQMLVRTTLHADVKTYEPINLKRLGVSYKKFRTLRPRVWVNDEIIGGYLSLLNIEMRKNGVPKTLFIPSFFFTQLMNEGRETETPQYEFSDRAIRFMNKLLRKRKCVCLFVH